MLTSASYKPRRHGCVVGKMASETGPIRRGTGTEIVLKAAPVESRKRRADEFVPASLPLEEAASAVLLQFEGAKMWVAKETVSTSATSTTWYHLVSSGDSDAVDLVKASVNTKQSGVPVSRDEQVIFCNKFFHTTTASEKLVETWEEDKFPGAEYSVATFRSKRGFKFLRLVQVDQAATGVRQKTAERLILPVTFGDAWIPYGRLRPDFKNISLESIEAWIGGGSSPNHFNSRLGDDADARDAAGWPKIGPALLRLFPRETSAELIQQAAAELEQLELGEHNLKEAAARIKDSDSMYGIIGPAGRVVVGTGAPLFDWTAPAAWGGC